MSAISCNHYDLHQRGYQSHLNQVYHEDHTVQLVLFAVSLS
ncbi:hypothetical protein MtrunA17_Chr8g0379791 [Medicago truncatula]|uniref:Uncharacterized protein n=1 Tax=Medicago truncatula TaxID=3880 RepID=A0A396GV50_MEDTR|nr:hypothetical protein MtrunA17_Chr8g0379791 [Medicago truncatula]